MNLHDEFRLLELDVQRSHESFEMACNLYTLESAYDKEGRRINSTYYETPLGFLRLASKRIETINAELARLRRPRVDQPRQG